MSEEKENPIESYVMNASRSVDNILLIDKLRQEMALRKTLFRGEGGSPAMLDRSSEVMSVIAKRHRGGRAESIISSIQHD